MLTRPETMSALGALSWELCKAQRHIVAQRRRVLVIVEGRDGSGKGGVIRCVARRLDPSGVSIVRLSTPSERERGQWFFQRYVPHLPGEGELTLFDRSWYNRAGLEPVMGYCTPAQASAFLEEVPIFEGLLARSGLQIIKIHLTISREEQARRMARREADPLREMTAIDRGALARWDDYSRAESEMFRRTSTAAAPWVRVVCDDKRRARLEVIRTLLSCFEYPDKATDLAVASPELVKRVPTCEVIR